MKKLFTPPTIVLSLAIATLVAIAAIATAQSSTAVSSSETTVHRFADASVVDGATTQLIRTADAVAMELRTTGLEPGAPYTAWWVVFDTPEGCSDACGEDDIFGADGMPDPNPAANVSILFADGALTDAGGSAAFSGVLTEARPFGEVVMGEGLTDATGAEVHLVVRAHGDLDPGRAWAQLTTFEPHPAIGGDCGACTDVQFAVFPPDGATAAR